MISEDYKGMCGNCLHFKPKNWRGRRPRFDGRCMNGYESPGDDDDGYMPKPPPVQRTDSCEEYSPVTI